MSSRVSPAERLRAEIDEVFASGVDLAGAVEQVARLAARLPLHTALEAEVTEFLGRDRYDMVSRLQDLEKGFKIDRRQYRL